MSNLRGILGFISKRFALNKRAQFSHKPLLSKEHLQKFRVFATTVIRESENHELTGYLLELDWKNNQIKERIPIPIETGHPFWNARGGNRGGRGVFCYDGVLYVATATTVLLYNRELKQIGEITHPHLAGLHEIYVDSEGIWLTSTVHDLIIKLDFNGDVIDEWWGSESEVLQEAFGFSDRDLNLALDFPEEDFVEGYERYCEEEVFHVNTVWPYKGRVYVLGHRKNAMIRIRPMPERVVVRDNRLRSPHNSIIIGDRIIINDTQNQCLRTYELSSGRRMNTLNTPVYGSGKSKQFAKAGWQRGLAHVEDSICLVGTSPATVFEVDIDKGTIGQICKIDTDVRHCVHGLTVAENF